MRTFALRRAIGHLRPAVTERRASLEQLHDVTLLVELSDLQGSLLVCVLRLLVDTTAGHTEQQPQDTRHGLVPQQLQVTAGTK